MAATPLQDAQKFFEDAKSLTVTLGGPEDTPFSERSSTQFLKKAKALLKSPITYLTVGAAIASAGVINDNANKLDAQFYDNSYSISSSVESGHLFSGIDDRYDGMFDRDQPVYLFSSSEADQKYAAELFGEDASKAIVEQSRFLNESDSDGVALKLSANDSPSECVVIVNQERVTPGSHKLLNLVDQQMFHCYDFYNKGTQIEGNAAYSEYLTQSGADAFATLMHNKQFGPPSMEAVVDHRQEMAENLFNHQVDLDSAISQATISAHGVAETQSQYSLSRLSAKQMSQKASGIRNVFGWSETQFEEFRDSVRIIREAAAGNPIDAKQAPPYLKTWSYIFSGYDLESMGPDYKSTHDAVNYYLDNTSLDTSLTISDTELGEQHEKWATDQSNTTPKKGPGFGKS